jgi:hypothetical protein
MGKNRGARWRPLGEMLFDNGLVTDAELSEALSEQGSLGLPLGEIVVTRGYVSRPTLLRVLATQQNLEVDLERGFGSGLFDAIDKRNRCARPVGPRATVQTDLLQLNA